MKSQMNRRQFLQTLAAGTAAGILTGCQAPFLKTLQADTSCDFPNIVFIMADDMGYGDPGCYGATKIKTPNIDRVARQGVRFTDAHTPSAVCTPTRYGVLTGRYCWRSRLKKGVLYSGHDPLLIEPDRLTVASLLKSKGYDTAAVGKWHVGLGLQERADFSKQLEPGPLALGFNYAFILPASHDIAPYCFVENGYVVGELTEQKKRITANQNKGLATKGWTEEKIAPEITKKAVKFIENHAKTNKNQPFFLYFTPAAPHLPNIPAEFMQGTSQAGDRGDHVQEFDWSVGQVLDTLDRLNLADNTLVIITSDNGGLPGDFKEGTDITNWPTYGHKTNDDLKGWKADIYDGGHRVSFVARWPGKIKPDSTSSELICLTDLTATCAAITKSSLPDNAAEDSYNVLPALLNQKLDKPIREAVVHHSLTGVFAIRQGKWKLIPALGSGGLTKPQTAEPNPGEPAGQLYDMENDPAETKNLWSQHPDVVERLTALLEKYKNQGHSRPLSAL